MYDSIIIGGGTAGLSAALVLGRARRRVLLVSATPRPNNDLASQLGCELVAEGMQVGHIQVDQRWQTSVPGVFAAGDVSTAMQQVAAAAASGAMVGAQINFALVEREIHELTAVAATQT